MYGEMGGAVLPASMLTEILFPGALGLSAPSARTKMALASSITNSLLGIPASLSESDRNFPYYQLGTVDYISERTQVYPRIEADSRVTFRLDAPTARRRLPVITTTG